MTGSLAYRGGLDMPQAFGVPRRYVRGHNLRLAQVVRQVVSRQLSTDLLLEHASARDIHQQG